MPVLVHMDDTGRMVNRKTKTDKTKTGTNPIPQFLTLTDTGGAVLTLTIDCAPYCQYYPN